MDPSVDAARATEAVSLISLGSGERELVDLDGASSGSQTQVFFGVQSKRSRTDGVSSGL